MWLIFAQSAIVVISIETTSLRSLPASLSPFSFHPCTCSLTCSLTHCSVFTHLLAACSLTHSQTHSLARLQPHSLTHQVFIELYIPDAGLNVGVRPWAGQQRLSLRCRGRQEVRKPTVAHTFVVLSAAREGKGNQMVTGEGGRGRADLWGSPQQRHTWGQSGPWEDQRSLPEERVPRSCPRSHPSPDLISRPGNFLLISVFISLFTRQTPTPSCGFPSTAYFAILKNVE